MRDTSLDLGLRSVEIILANQTASGAFVASPTFSQYGYCWLRDGAFTAHALDVAGAHAAAARFHDWVAEIVLARREGLERAGEGGRRGEAPRPEDYLHCRYTANGAESVVEWPSFQLDGPAIWLWALGEHVARGGELTSRHTGAACLVADYLAALWQCSSYDAWEEHPQHVHQHRGCHRRRASRGTSIRRRQFRSDRLRVPAMGRVSRSDGWAPARYGEHRVPTEMARQHGCRRQPAVARPSVQAL